MAKNFYSKRKQQSDNGKMVFLFWIFGFCLQIRRFGIRNLKISLDHIQIESSAIILSMYAGEPKKKYSNLDNTIKKYRSINFVVVVVVFS